MMNVTKPICSVCIANFNGAGFIEACIESVLTQGWGEKVEIIVHDDTSTDHTVELIRGCYPAVRLIISDKNVGFCVANNRMAAVAQGEYLLLLNNDARLFPDALHVLLNEAERLGRPAILGLPQYDAKSGQLLDIGSLLDPFLNPVPNLDPKRRDVGMVMGSCLWIPKRLWTDLGGFPEWFESIGEDLYLCCLARLWGYPVSALGISGYWHHIGQSFGGGRIVDNQRLSTTRRRRALSERNKSMVIILCYPMPLLAVLLPLHFWLLVTEGVVLSLFKRNVDLWKHIYWKCLKFLFKNVSHLMYERQLVQARKTIKLSSWLAVYDWMPYKLRMLLRYGFPEVHQ